MPANRVKIFGERNTGTNALSRIIEANSQARCLPATSGDLNPLLGRIGNIEWLPGKRMRERLLDSIFEGQSPLCAWKHCATNFPDATRFDGVFVLFTIRHPGSWLVSLFKRPYQQLERRPATLAEFLNSEWETAGREGLGRAMFRPLELLQAKLDSHLSLVDKLNERGIAHRFLRFEDIVLNQAALYFTIAPELENARADFHELETSTKDRSKTLNDYRDYYGKERWRDALTGLEAAIDAAIDWSKFERFGYRPLSAAISAAPGHREDQQGQTT